MRRVVGGMAMVCQTVIYRVFAKERNAFEMVHDS